MLWLSLLFPKFSDRRRSGPVVLRPLPDGGGYELIAGERRWRARGFQKGSLIAVDGNLIVLAETGELAIAKLSPKGYEEISRAKVIEPDGSDMRQRPIVWSHPAYAMKSCFIRNDSEVIRVSLTAE